MALSMTIPTVVNFIGIGGYRSLGCYLFWAAHPQIAAAAADITSFLTETIDKLSSFTANWGGYGGCRYHGWIEEAVAVLPSYFSS